MRKILFILFLTIHAVAHGQTIHPHGDSVSQDIYLGSLKARQMIMPNSLYAFHSFDSTNAVAIISGAWWYNNGSAWIAMSGGGGGSGTVTQIKTYGYMLGAPGTYTTTVNLTPDTSKLATKTNLSLYQLSLGFTPENVANKATSFGVLNNTLYPSTAATNTLVNASVAPKYNTADTTYLFRKADSNTHGHAVTYDYINSVIPSVPVTSVFGRTGAVVAASNDYSFAQLSGKPTTLAGYGITDYSGHSGEYLGSNGSAFAWFTPPTAIGTITTSTLLLTPLSGTGTSVAIDLPTVGASGTYGSSAVIPVPTLDAYGRVTGISTLNVTPAWANITGTPTTLAGYGITDVYTKTASDARFAPISVVGTVTNVIGGTNISITGTSTVQPTVNISGQIAVANGGTGTTTTTSVNATPITYGANNTITADPSGSAGGDLAGTYPNPTLTTSGVTAAAYGSATVIPVPTFDAKGRATGVTTVTATPAESSVTFTDITTNNSSTSKHGYIRKLSGTATDYMDGSGTWSTPTTIPSGAAGGDLTGTYPNPTLATSGVTAATYGSATVIPIITVDAKGRATTITTATATPAVGSITGLATGIATWLATPSSANLAAAVTDETGSGALVFATSPTFVTPLLGTPTSGVLTNCTGTASGLTAGNVTTNANLTGDITSTGNAVANVTSLSHLTTAAALVTVAAVTTGTWTATPVAPAYGGTGIANNAAMTVTGSGNFAYTRTLTATTNSTFPAGTQTLAGTTLAQSFTAGQAGTPTTLTDASTIAIDLSTSNNFRVTLGGNRTMGVPTNILVGQTGYINIWQDITGTRTLTIPYPYTYSAGTAPTLSTGKLSMDKLVYAVDYYLTSSSITATNATPGVFTWTAHGLISGMQIQFSAGTTTTPVLNTTYWVTVVDANSFKISTTFANAQAATFVTTSGTSGSLTANATGISVALNTDFHR